MLVLSVFIFLLINSNFESVENIEIPMIFIADKISVFVKYIYGLSILIAIFTTALSSGYGFLNNITKSKKAYSKLAIVICLISLIFRTA